jgi:hypothetical protein
MGKKEEDKSKVRRYPCTEFAEAELPKLRETFDYFLEENDPLYKNNINFIVSCTGPNDYFKIGILPVGDTNAKKYFESIFGEMPRKGKLEKFARRNNVKEFFYVKGKK